MKLTQAQIEAMAAKLDANGLKPGTPVYDMTTGEVVTREQLQAEIDATYDDIIDAVKSLSQHGLNMPADDE